MPRHARSLSPTGYYHVMLRGNNRESIFYKEYQKDFFMNSMKKQNDDQLMEITAYCLMDNHVHIVVNANPFNLVKAFKCLCTSYAMNFNRKEDKIGHVFQDRYKSEVITDDKYLLQVMRYVHNNPVKAKMVRSVVEYKWSSYTEYMNEGGIIGDQQKKFIMGYFSNNADHFAEFHKQKDDHEYLEINEDLQVERFVKGQEIISEYFQNKGLVEGRQVIKNPVYLEELIQCLLKKSRLTHRQIAGLLEISSSFIHKVSLSK